ncbi:MAG: hypothetical protein O2783_04800 [Chloroflexi bacterium]|nr:hypothetical protein [Chloroflexota bacterium]
MPTDNQTNNQVVSVASQQTGSFDAKAIFLRGKAVRLAVLLYQSESIR